MLQNTIMVFRMINIEDAIINPNANFGDMRLSCSILFYFLMICLSVGWWHETTETRMHNSNFQVILLSYQSVCDTTVCSGLLIAFVIFF